MLMLLLVLVSGGALEGILADQITTSVLGDGSVLSSSLWLSDGLTISGQILGSGLTRIDRKTSQENDRYDSVMASSEGTLLIGEYGSIKQKNRDLRMVCVFGNMTGQDSLRVIRGSGILRHANYSRSLNPDPFESIILAEGTGMMDISHHLVANGTRSGRTSAAGNISIMEQIKGNQGYSH
jgi:hypothetical protein